MSASLIATALIVLVIALITFVFNKLIYKKTTGGSKAYYFWALASAFIVLGASVGFVSSFVMDPNKTEVGGIDGLIAVIQLSLYLVGYVYIALGAVFLPGDLKITNVNLEKIQGLKKFVFLGIVIWGSLITLLLAITGDELPVRMFYVPFFAFAWVYGMYNIYPFYNAVKSFAGYWRYMLLGFIFGLLSNISEIIAYLILDQLIILKPMFYAFMGVFLVLGFFKLGRDLKAF